MMIEVTNVVDEYNLIVNVCMLIRFRNVCVVSLCGVS